MKNNIYIPSHIFKRRIYRIFWLFSIVQIHTQIASPPKNLKLQPVKKKFLFSFYLFANFSFTTSESKVDFCHQTFNVRVISQVAKQLKTLTILANKNIYKNLKIEVKHNQVPNLPFGNKTLAIALENRRKKNESFKFSWKVLFYLI